MRKLLHYLHAVASYKYSPIGIEQAEPRLNCNEKFLEFIKHCCSLIKHGFMTKFLQLD